LHQLGKKWAFYADDCNGLLCPYSDSSNNIRWYDGYAFGAYIDLPYGRNNKLSGTLFNCPLQQEDNGDDPTYAKTTGGTHADSDGVVHKNDYIPIYKLKNPSEKVNMADGGQYYISNDRTYTAGTFASRFLAQEILSTSSAYYIISRHAGNANYLFFDGHVESIPGFKPGNVKMSNAVSIFIDHY
jgi:prepilin-type processing-associated H-X9-DG protein